MHISRQTKRLDILCLGLVLAACALHVVGQHQLIGTTVNIGTFACYAAAILTWSKQGRRRLLQRPVRRYFTFSAILMLFWMAARTLKYVFIVLGQSAGRYMWYLYYLPFVFIPLLMFFSVLYIGRPEEKRIDRRWSLLYIPAALLFLAVLTNDLHFLAFEFPGGLANWSDAVFVRGPVYYAVVIWIGLLFAANTVIAFVRCAVTGNRRNILLPVLPFVFGTAYLALSALKPHSFILSCIPSPEAGCVFYASFMESLILAHFFPSNDGYGDFWNASSIGAGIIDSSGILRYKSERCIPVSARQAEDALGRTVLLREGCYALRNHRVSGGIGYWTKDISDISRLNSELAELGDVLVEQNAMLDAENRMEESRVRVEQQSKLYDRVARSVSPQLSRLGELLDDPPEDEEEFIAAMKYACVLNAYFKRYSNLTFLADRSNTVSSGELKLAIAESLEYIRLCGAEAFADYHGEEKLPCGAALVAYELFETMIEAALPGLRAVLAELTAEEDKLTLRLELSGAGRLAVPEELGGRIMALGGALALTNSDEDDARFVNLLLPTGGETA